MTSAQQLAPWMFLALVGLMLVGFPVSFSLAALGLGFGYTAIHLGLLPEAFMGNVPLRLFGVLSNELLLSIPFFTFMGAILERCGLAEDLLEGCGQLFGKVPGGLGFAVIVVGAILGAITGTVAASVIAMGVISLPIMMRYGYNVRYATGVIAASGTIAQLIPPSLVLVVLADQMGTSVGDMYRGAIGPSILQTAIFLLYTAGIATLRPHWVPALPAEARHTRGWPLIRRVLWGMIPSMVLMFLVLGTIFLGLATPTEAGALGAVGAMVLAAMHRRLSWALVWEGLNSTMRISTMVMFILLGSTIFTLVFLGLDGGKWVESMLSSLPGGRVGFLVVVNAFVFFLAFFLDFFEIAFIVVPLLAPVADKMGINLVWFGVLLCVNIQTSFMHPPFGFALFYLRGIADQIFKRGSIKAPIQSRDLYWGAVPWVLMQLMLVGITIAWPSLVTHWLDARNAADVDRVKIEMPTNDDLGGQSDSLDGRDEEADDAMKAVKRAIEAEGAASH